MAEYIDRDKALTVFCNFCGVCPEEKRDPAQCVDILCLALKELEPADVRPVVRGQWIPFTSEAAGDIWYCSACEIGFPHRMDFCPHCGADMRSEKEDKVS